VENVVTRTIGEDIQKPDFWNAAIMTLEEPLNALQAILPAVLPVR
jgi:hypothetical protein